MEKVSRQDHFDNICELLFSKYKDRQKLRYHEITNIIDFRVKFPDMYGDLNDNLKFGNGDHVVSNFHIIVEYIYKNPKDKKLLFSRSYIIPTFKYSVHNGFVSSIDLDSWGTDSDI